MRKIDRNLYRYAEDALKSYHDDCERLALLNEHLEAAIGPEPGASVRGGISLAQQDAIMDRKFGNAEYVRLCKRVRVLEYILDTLPNSDMKLVETRYFRGLPWPEVAAALHVDENTARRRRAPKIIVRVAKILFGDLC